MFYYDSKPLEEQLNMRTQRRDAGIFEEDERSRMFAENMNNLRYTKENNDNKFRKYISEAKTTLLTEAIFYFVNESFDHSVTLDQRKQAEAVVLNFVKEEGADKLLRKYETQTEFLANLTGIVNETYDKIVKEANENKIKKITGFNMKKSTTDAFYNKLQNISNTQVTNKIMDMVAQETEDFIKQSVEDKNKMEQMARDTKEKIDNIKARTPEAKEAIKQEMVNTYNRESKLIRTNRPRSIFEEMVYHISNKVVKHKDLLESHYVNKSGQLDVNKITENAKVLYTVLETLNTFKFKTFDAESIQELVQNI